MLTPSLRPFSFSRFLPGNRQNGNRLLLVVLAASLSAPVAARAVNDPQLVFTFPRDGGAVKSQAIGTITATFDRDLASQSRIRLFDTAGAPVPGVSFLSGDPSSSGGRRVIAFRPDDPLGEAASPYTATARACPVPGDCSNHIWIFRIDDTPPAAPLVTVPTDGSVVSDQPVVVRGSAEAGARAAVVESDSKIAESVAHTDGSFIVELPYPAEDGVSHTIAAHAIDEAGNASGPSPNITFWHDSIVQIPVITQPVEGAFLNTTTVRVCGTAKPDTTVTVSKGTTTKLVTPADGAGAWCGNATFGEATHTITATSFDGVSVDGPSAPRTFTVDLSAPAPPVITSPAEGAALAQSSVTIAGTAEGDSLVTIREDGNLRGTARASAAGAWSLAIAFVDGPHAVVATATDRAENVSLASAPRTFIVDTKPPPLPTITSPVAGTYFPTSSVTVAGKAEESQSVLIEESKTALGTALVDGTGHWSITLAFDDGLHAVTATAIDRAGNRSARTDPRAFTVDTEAPAVPVINSPIEGGGFTNSQVFVAGTAEASAQVRIHEGAALVGTAFVDHSGNWSVVISFANGTHSITATARDFAGNESAPSLPRTFSVGVSTDTTAPAVPTFSEPLPNSLQPGQVAFRGTSEPATTVRVFEGGFMIGSATASASGFWQLGATLASGSHTVSADATDEAGNRSARAPSLTFRVDASRPKVAFDEAQKIVFLAPVEEVTLEGTATDDNAVVRVELEYYNDITGTLVNAAPAGQCTGCPGPQIRWKATPLLTPGVYKVLTFAVDVVGNRSQRAEITIIVA